MLGQEGPFPGKGLGQETGKETHIQFKIPQWDLGVRLEPAVGIIDLGER